MDEAYFVRAHAEFLEMGLEDSARQLVEEALVAFPYSEQLLRLAGKEPWSGDRDKAAAGEAYFAQAYREFVDMGLQEQATQLLREALEAHPGSQQLQDLAIAAGPPSLPFTQQRQQLEPPQSTLSLPCSFVRPAVLQAEDMPSAVFWPAVRERGLHELLLLNGGMLRVLDVLPENIAEATLSALAQIPASEWTLSTTDSVAYVNGDAIRHTYYSYLGDKINSVITELRALSPKQWAGFQAAKYEACGHIAPHDDSQLFRSPGNEHNPDSAFPPGCALYRKIACIYYLTKDWRQEYGGSLVDLHHPERRRALIPEFNSMVAFIVPRMHEVEALAQACPPRYSVFGWFSDDRPYLPLQQHGPEMSCLEVWKSRR